MSSPGDESQDKKTADAAVASSEPAEADSENESDNALSDSKTEESAKKEHSTADNNGESPKVEPDPQQGKDDHKQKEESKENHQELDNNESSTEPPEKESEASSLTLTQHHVSHLLSDVLEDEKNAEEPPPIKGIRFPMIFDCLLACGLLVAVGGFTVGLFHMYIVHSASQYISEQRYDKAITVLKGAPLPQVFSRTGSDTEELLSKAQYLDAMDKIESNTDVEGALKELGEIRPGSKFFALAQEAINENTEPAPIMLQGGAETTEEALPNAEDKQSLLEKALKEEERK